MTETVAATATVLGRNADFWSTTLLPTTDTVSVERAEGFTAPPTTLAPSTTSANYENVPGMS